MVLLWNGFPTVPRPPPDYLRVILNSRKKLCLLHFSQQCLLVEIKKTNRKSKSNGLSVEEEVLAALTEFTAALENDEVAERMTCRQFTLDRQTSAYDAQLVKDTRKVLGISQGLFARFLGVAANTVRSWEQGASRPSRIARRYQMN